MMLMYRKDVVKSLQIIARRRGLSTSYEDCSTNTHMKQICLQQSETRRKRSRIVSDENNDPNGPPDTLNQHDSKHHKLIITSYRNINTKVLWKENKIIPTEGSLRFHHQLL